MLTVNKRSKAKQNKTEKGSGIGNNRLLLSVYECAELAGNSAWFWRRGAYAGRIASVKLGTSLRIPREEVLRIIEESTRPRVA